MNRKLVIIFATIGILLVAFGFVMWFVFGESSVFGGDGDNGGQIATEVEEKSKDEITVDDLKSRLESVVDYQFFVKTTSDIKSSVYKGLNSTAIVKSDNIVIASLDVYDSEEDAMAVIADVKSANTTGYDTETGKNYESISSGKSFVERVGKTVLTVSADNSKLVDAIKEAIKY